MAMQLSGDFNGVVSVRNADGLIANLQQVYSRVRREIKVVVGDSASRIEQRTIDLCPKRSFYMSEHVRTKFSKTGYTYTVGWTADDFIGTTDATGQPRSFYPFFIEFGTRRMRARPSLSIAYKEEEPRFKAGISKALSEAYARGTRQS